MKTIFLSILLALSCELFAQQPQTALTNPQAIQGINAKWAQGVGTGYWPTCNTTSCNTLVLSVAAGTCFDSSGGRHTYAGGTLTLTATQTNYVTLSAAGCVVQFNTTGYGADVPLATVTTSGSAITGLTDDRTYLKSTTLNLTAHTIAVPLTCLDSSGSGTVQSCTTSPTFVPAAGDTIIYDTTTTNTGDVTINVNSSSAVHARKWQASATLAAGDLVAGVYMLATYDGTYWEFYTIGNAPSGGGGGNCNSGAAQCIYVPNCAATGTTNGKLAKWGNTGVNNSCAVIVATGDAGLGVELPLIGVVVSGGGTTGNAFIAVNGTVPCAFDAITGGIQGGYVGISASISGDCRANNNSPANENPNTNYFFALQDVAAVASSTNNIDMMPVPPTYGNVGAAFSPPVMEFSGAASYGGPRTFPMDLFQGNSTATANNWVGGFDCYHFYYSSSSFFDSICPSTAGSSAHDLLIDNLSSGQGLPSVVATRVNGETYSIPNVQNITGTIAVGQAGHFRAAASGGDFIWTLTGNSTLPVTENENTGHVAPFIICQNGTGGFTFTWPATTIIDPTAVPAAASSCVGQLFMFDGTNMRPLAPAVPIQVVKTSQVASIGATTITTPQAAGMYRVTATLDCDSSSAAATVSGVIGWTDPSNTAQTANIPTSTCTTLGGASVSTLITAFRIKANTAVTYSTTIANTPTYDLSLALETMTQ